MSTAMWIGKPMTVAALVATFVLLGLGTTVAQAPPVPPHQFFGSVSTGSGATVNGTAVGDGTVITAVDGVNVAVATGTISSGTWSIQVNPSDATSVSFRIGNSNLSQSFTVTSGALTEVTLNLTSGTQQQPPPTTPPPTTPPPTALPNGGSGGIAGLSGLAETSALLALVLLGIGVVAAVSVIGVRLTRRPDEFDS